MPVGDLRDEAEAVCKHCYRFLLQKQSTSETVGLIDILLLASLFHVGG